MVPPPSFETQICFENLVDVRIIAEPGTNRKGRKAGEKDREVNSLRNFAITLRPLRLMVFFAQVSMI
jgi:hypothetical protein